MPIKRISDQKSKTLEEFYLEISQEGDTVSTDIGKATLNLITIINQTFIETQIWALTSLNKLVLLTCDDWKSNWFVTIGCRSNKEYYFEYLLPFDKSPWKNATVMGTANSLDEAKTYLLISMKECNGWTDCLELKKSLSEFKL